MNLALGAFIVILLLLPGLTFRLGLASVQSPKNKLNRKKVNNEKEDSANDLEERQKHRYLRLIRFTGILNSLNFTDTIFFFSVIPVIIHLFCLLLLAIFTRVLNFQVELSLLLKILIGKDSIDVTNNNLIWLVVQFLIYICLGMIIAYIGGRLSFSSSKILRITAQTLGKDNAWYKLFVTPFAERELNEKIYLISLDVLVTTKEATLIYSGYLKEFYFKPGTKDLDYLILSNPSRMDMRKESREISNAQQKTQSFSIEYGDATPIPGKFIIIPANEILNVNAFYLEKGIQDDQIVYSIIQDQSI